MISSRLAASAIAAVVVTLAVSGCASESRDVGAPSATASVSPTATPTPEPASTAVSDIHLRSDGLSLVTESGVETDSVTFTDDPASAVSLLSDSLGFEPAISTGGQPRSWGLWTRYRWEGLVLQAPQDPDNPDSHLLAANFVARDVRGVRLVGPEGVMVGDSRQTLPAPISVGSFEGNEIGPRYLLGPPTPGDHGFAHIDDYYVQAFAGTDSDAVVELWAPASSVFPGYTLDLITPAG